MDKTIFYSILTRNHGKYLPHYFRMLEEQTYDKKLITVYINTNNNDDDTLNLLSEWVSKNANKYRNIIFEKGEDHPLITKGAYWEDNGSVRLQKMAKVRNRSLDICKLEKADYYFVCDTDNWICPSTLNCLIEKQKPIVAPFLKNYIECNAYSNYFCAVNRNGYMDDHADTDYKDIWLREKIGCFKVPLVHCTYLIDCQYLDKLSYTSNYWGTHHYEFVIFANNAREQNVDQYICNEKMFGFVNYSFIIDQNNCYDLLLEKYRSDNTLTNLNKDTN